MEKKKGLLGRMLAAFAKDADTSPEDLENASKFIAGHEAKEEEKEPVKVEAHDDERVEALEAELAALKKQIAELTAKGEDDEEEVKEEPTALDDLEEELKKPETEDDEDAVTVSPEEINKANGEETEDDEEELVEAKDDDGDAKEAILKVIEAVKPLMAQLPAAQRKEASDSMANLLRSNLQDRQYKVLARAQKNAHTAKDANPMMDDALLGKLIRDKYNPHYSK